MSAPVTGSHAHDLAQLDAVLLRLTAMRAALLRGDWTIGDGDSVDEIVEVLAALNEAQS